MSLLRLLGWSIAAAVVGGGLYFLLAGGETPEAAAPPAPARTQALTPAPAAVPDLRPEETVSPGDALAQEAREAEEKIKRDQAEEIRAMPAPPPDMGMTDKAGIAKDAEEAAKAAAGKPRP